MRKTIWEPSYDRGCELVRLGVELPYLDDLPRKRPPQACDLHVSELGGYLESIVIDNKTSTDYAVALRIRTDRSRATVKDFSLTPPWPEHEICWDFDPGEELSKSLTRQRMDEYERLFGTRLLDILKDHRTLYGGHPVEGLLFGRAMQPIPPSVSREAPAMAKMVLVSDSDTRACARLQLWIYTPRRHSGASERQPSQKLEAIALE